MSSRLTLEALGTHAPQGTLQSDHAAAGDAEFPMTRKWFVLHTRSRQEKAVGRDLDARNVEYFLPLTRSVRYYGKRKMLVEEPVFPGYLFLRGERDDAFTADRTGRIANILAVQDQLRLDSELLQIRRVIETGGVLPASMSIKFGDWVEVTSGPFKGIRGWVESSPSSTRLILQVQAIGQATALEIDRALLRRVDQCA